MIPNIAPLRNVGAFLTLMEQVQTRAMGLPGMACFHGPSGFGKTTAVTFAANEYRAYVVQVKSVWSPSHLARTILAEMGVTEVNQLPRMVDAIGLQLARTNRPLIIDDAQYLLKKGMVQVARDIYESSFSPVVLVGEEKLPQDLTRFENIHNRFLAWQPALACNLADARLLAGIYAHRVEVADDLLTAILDASGGNARRVSVNLANAQELCSTRGTKVADAALWGSRAFYTGEPPTARQLQQPPAGSQRRAS